MAESVKQIIRPCTCEHEYQDSKHGKGMRVHNVTGQSKKVADQGTRCTVCGNGGRPADRIFKSPNGHYALDTGAYDKAFPKKK